MVILLRVSHQLGVLLQAMLLAQARKIQLFLNIFVNQNQLAIFDMLRTGIRCICRMRHVRD